MYLAMSAKPGPNCTPLRKALGTGLLFLAVAGCHSLRLGPLVTKPAVENAVVHAKFGTPIATDELAATQNKTDDCGQMIDLESALRLAGLDNPTIALADEIVRESVAERTLARSLLFPTLQAGASINVHRGYFQNPSGAIVEVNRQATDFGFGTGAVGAGPVTVPGLSLVGPLADAIFAPQIAQANVVRTNFLADATRHATLLDVGIAYVTLAAAQASAEAYRQTLAEMTEVERLTANQAKAGQGRESDARRAESETLLVKANVEQAQQDINIASAGLARLLDVDPSLRLRSDDVVPPLLEMVDPNLALEPLIAQALANHPELSAATAAVRMLELRVRQERARPFLPIVSLGFSAGGFGGGSQTTPSPMGGFNGRLDLDVVAVWSLQNMGAGNHAIQNGARAQWEQAVTAQSKLLDRIRREVAEAHALTQTRRLQRELAQRRLQTAQNGLTLDMDRIRNLKGRPIEILDSANKLSAARQELISARAGYSQAQLQLFVALGNMPSVNRAMSEK